MLSAEPVPYTILPITTAARFAIGSGPVRFVRHRLEKITAPRPVPKGSGLLYLKMDLDKVRSFDIGVHPIEWQRKRHFRMAFRRVNCIAHAVGLHNSDFFLGTLEDDLRALRTPRAASLEFAEVLLGYYWRRKKATPRAGDLIVYCEGPNKRVKHMGVVLIGGVIRSKWGELPAIFDHRTWQVPLSFGETVQYYHPMPLSAVEASYSQFYGLA